jgi:hypothetical protein
VSNRPKEKSVLQADLWFCLFFLALLAVFFIAAGGYKPVTRRAPLIVMIPLAVMLLGQLVLTVKNLRRVSAAHPEQKSLLQINRQAIHRAFQILLWLVLLLVMIYVGGHLAGIAVFLFLFLRFVCHDPWRTTIYVSAGSVAALYLLFERLLMIPLYTGLIYEAVSAWWWS